MADSNPSPPKADLFAALPRTDRLEAPVESPAEPAAPPRRKSPTRWIVPLALFVLIIGGLAWLVQYMPAWRSKAPREVKAAPQKQLPLLGFVHPYNRQGYVTAMWETPGQGEKASSPYVREFERSAEGRYVFPFGAHPDEDVEIGLISMGCDCAKLHVALVSKEEADAQIKLHLKAPDRQTPELPGWQWQPLEKSNDRGVALPAGSFALLRMTWTNRRSPGESLNLSAKLWARHGGVRREEYGITVPAVSSAPLRVRHDRAEVGVLEPGAFGKAEFLLWSPTRDGAAPVIVTGDDLIVARLTALDVKEAADLQALLRGQLTNTRVRSAWRVAVQVHEAKGNNHLPLGHFLRNISAQLPDSADDPTTLVISGFVRGPVEVGAVDDQAKIQLGSFKASDGRRKIIYFATDHKTSLKHRSTQPTTVEVKLHESVNEKTATKRKWVLEVVVPPNQLSGTITDDNAVILETDSQPPRQIRIPIVGHAVQG